MDIEKHIREKSRLNQALNGNLDGTIKDIKEVLRKNNIDLTPGVAFDVFVHTLEEIHLEKFNLHMFVR